MKMYTVVENAGYEGEQDVKQFRSYWDALRWLERTYDIGEIETLHVQIARDQDGCREYV